MFGSLELSRPLPAGLGDVYNTYNINFGRLVNAFEAIESPRYRVALLNAFPADSLTFAKTFKAMAQSEMERRTSAADELSDCLDSGESLWYTILPDIPHTPRHDGESAYWVLLWALGCALPLGSPDEGTGHLNTFYEKMSWEGSAVSGCSSYRYNYLRPTSVEGLLHSRLKYFERFLLEHMAAYFSIPWDLYRHEVGPWHAHIALRRLLLLALLHDKPTLNVELDTERVRHCNVTIFSIQTPEYSAPVSTFATMAHTFFDTTGTASQFSGLSAAASNSPFANNDEEDTDAVQQTIVAQKRPASSALSQYVLTGAADPGAAPAAKRAKLSITAMPRTDA